MLEEQTVAVEVDVAFMGFGVGGEGGRPKRQQGGAGWNGNGGNMLSNLDEATLAGGWRELVRVRRKYDEREGTGGPPHVGSPLPLPYSEAGASSILDAVWVSDKGAHTPIPA